MGSDRRRSQEAERYRRWYGTGRWQRLRARQLAAHPLCKMCAASDRVTAATVCDHVEPHRGCEIAFWSGPFQSLCAEHHNRDKQSLERGGKPRMRVGLDGWPVQARGRSDA